MNYICLAAGKGTRFGSLGAYLQKCMYPIGLKPFLEFTLESLTSSSLFDPEHDCLSMVVGHKAQQIKDYFGDSYRSMPIKYVVQSPLLGTGHALIAGFEAAGKPSQITAWLADTYIPSEVFESIGGTQMRDLITVARQDDGQAYHYRVTLDHDNGRVKRSWEGDSPYVEIGCWRLSSDSVTQMGRVKSDEFRVLYDLQRQIDRGLKLGFIEAPQFVHLGGTYPTPEANLRTVFRTLAPALF